MKRLLSISLAFTLACAARAQFGSTQNNVTLTGTGSNVAANSTLTINATATFADKAIGSNQVLYVANTTTGNVTGLGIGANLSITGGNITGNTNGTVTSVGLIVPGGFGVTGGPITTSGSITINTALVGIITGNGTGFGNLTDPLVVGHGGTGLATGTSGGIPYFASTSTMASSGALTANNIVIGGGAGATPFPLGAVGTTTTVLHGNAAGLPTFSTVNLTTDVGNILPFANGGLGFATTTKGNIVIGNNTTTIGQLGVGANGFVLTANSSAALGIDWETGGAGTGNVTGPGSSTADHISTWNGTLGTSIKDSGVAIANVPTLSGTNTFTAQNTFAAGTITTSAPITITQTWNAGGVTFNGVFINVTDTASASASNVLTVQLNSTTDLMKVRKDGNLIFQEGMFGGPSDGTITFFNQAGTGFTKTNYGGNSASFPSIKRNGAAFNFRLADDSGDAAITTGAITASGNVIVPTHTPSSASDTGTTGTVTWDASFIYICTGTNAWKRVAIATW